MACLPNESNSSSGRKAYVVGWGAVSFFQALLGYFSSYLKYTIIQIYQSKTCSNVFTKFSKNWDVQICAGDKSGRRDTCHGKKNYFSYKCLFKC